MNKKFKSWVGKDISREKKTQKETCLKCDEKFEDINFNPKLPLAKRIYCNDRIDFFIEEEGGKKNE